MFAIIDDNKKILISDNEYEQLRATALIYGEKTEDGVVPMFDEDTVDEAIKEYADEDIEIAYTGEKYLKGFAPAIDNEYQSKQREIAYTAEVDKITAHIQRLRDKEQTEEVIAQITELIAERDAKVEEIKARFPYSTDLITE